MKKIASEKNYRIFKEAQIGPGTPKAKGTGNKPGQSGRDNPVLFAVNQVEGYIKMLQQEARKGDKDWAKSRVNSIRQLLATIEKALSSESPFSN